jgi:hypothetical protein
LLKISEQYRFSSFYHHHHIITKCEKTFQQDYENGDQSCSILVPFWGW